jgi:hypothetical protein
LFLSLITPDFHGLIERKTEIDAEYSLIKLLLALKAYYVEINDLPKRLEELVPIYINRIPEDPFAKKILRYIKSQKIIYSVGKDMEDNHGDEQKDIVIQLDFIGDKSK